MRRVKGPCVGPGRGQSKGQLVKHADDNATAEKKRQARASRQVACYFLCNPVVKPLTSLGYEILLAEPANCFCS